MIVGLVRMRRVPIWTTRQMAIARRSVASSSQATAFRECLWRSCINATSTLTSISADMASAVLLRFQLVDISVREREGGGSPGGEDGKPRPSRLGRLRAGGRQFAFECGSDEISQRGSPLDRCNLRAAKEVVGQIQGRSHKPIFMPSCIDVNRRKARAESAKGLRAHVP